MVVNSLPRALEIIKKIGPKMFKYIALLISIFTVIAGTVATAAFLGSNESITLDQTLQIYQVILLKYVVNFGSIGASILVLIALLYKGKDK
ncbi:hypothetical protein [Paenibacillus agilis]|uniref:Uncharacterized protein n=1 Tax=Paenibacillus agilis TaxID=3020863 RepID=A0A559ID77_9BACL|nr:hypothetical protein [Paenibacillus agilis]TVX85594.1 hypothetical protein FPZ44_24885 [Paenibacillus agilis]